MEPTNFRWRPIVMALCRGTRPWSFSTGTTDIIIITTTTSIIITITTIITIVMAIIMVPAIIIIIIFFSFPHLIFFIRNHQLFSLVLEAYRQEETYEI